MNHYELLTLAFAAGGFLGTLKLTLNKIQGEMDEVKNRFTRVEGGLDRVQEALLNLPCKTHCRTEKT